MTPAAAAVFAALFALAAAQGRPGELGSSCSRNSECTVPRSACNYGSCGCAETYTRFEDRCVRKIGDKCPDGLCSDVDESSCRFSETTGVNTCQCHHGLKNTGNGIKCYKTPEHAGDFCGNDADCTFMGISAACVQDQCACRDAHYVAHEDRCKQKIDELGALCNPRTDACFLQKDGDKQNVQCLEGKCQCVDGAKESADRQSCNNGTSLTACMGSILFIVMAKIFS